MRYNRKNWLCYICGVSLVLVLNLFPKYALASGEMGKQENNLTALTWQTEICSCKGNVDTSQISIVNAHLFFNRFDSLHVKDRINWPDIYKYNHARLRKERSRYISEYDTKINKLYTIKLPKSPSVKKYMEEVIYEVKLEKFLYISELDYLLSGSNTHLMNKFNGYDHSLKCDKWSKNLESEKSVYEALPQFIEEKCRTNGNPNKCKARALARTSSINGAKIDLLMLGWHNCANRYYRKFTSSHFEDAYKEMKKYVKDLKCLCGH